MMWHGSIANDDETAFEHIELKVSHVWRTPIITIYHVDISNYRNNNVPGNCLYAGYGVTKNSSY